MSAVAIFALLAVLLWPSQPRLTMSGTPRQGAAGWVARLLDPTVLIWALTGAVGSYFILGAVGVPVGIAGGVFAGLIRQKAELPEHRVRARLLKTQSANAMETLAMVLKAGVPITEAVACVADESPEPTAAVLRRVVAQYGIGSGAEQAWLSISTEPGWELVANEFAAIADTGAGLAELLLSTAQEARDEQNASIQTKARSVSVRSVLPMMCCFLPSFLLVGVVPIIAGLFDKELLG